MNVFLILATMTPHVGTTLVSLIVRVQVDLKEKRVLLVSLNWISLEPWPDCTWDEKEYYFPS